MALSPKDYKFQEVSINEDSHDNIDLEGTSGNTSLAQVRWLVLALVSFQCFSEYFIKELPPELFYPFTTADRFSLTLLPDIFFSFLGGVLVSRLGTRPILVIFGFFALIGQSMLTVAAYHELNLLPSISWILSRGSEAVLWVARTTIIVNWFSGRELSYALAVYFCTEKLQMYLGDFLNRFLNWRDRWYFYFSGTIICFLSWIAILCLNKLNKSLESSENVVIHSDRTYQNISFKDTRNLKKIYFLLILIIAILPSVFSGIIYSLGYNQDRTLEAVIVIPFIGYFIDKIGKRITIIFGTFCLFLLNCIFSISFPSVFLDVFSVELLGALILSVFETVAWPCIALVVENKMIGVTFGIARYLKFFINVSVIRILAAGHSAWESHRMFDQVVISGLVILGMIVTTLILKEDKKDRGVLEKPDTKENLYKRN